MTYSLDRIRSDLALDNGIAMWLSCDNLRKGAALNAIQIAEEMLERDLLPSKERQRWHRRLKWLRSKAPDRNGYSLRRRGGDRLRQGSRVSPRASKLRLRRAGDRRTTGESPSMSDDEKVRLFAEVKEEVGEEAAVIAGSTDNNHRKSVELSIEAEKVGADGLLLTVPAYNKPTQEGLYQHFKAIAAATSLPGILYNVPSRTSLNMTMPPRSDSRR